MNKVDKKIRKEKRRTTNDVQETLSSDRRPSAIAPKTLEAVKASNRVDIIEQMANEREAFYRSLSNVDTFGGGWLRRNDETMEQTLNMG